MPPMIHMQRHGIPTKAELSGWFKTFSTPPGAAAATASRLVVDTFGNIYASSPVSGGTVIVKFSPEGDALAATMLNTMSGAFMVITPTNRIYIAGPHTSAGIGIAEIDTNLLVVNSKRYLARQAGTGYDGNTCTLLVLSPTGESIYVASGFGTFAYIARISYDLATVISKTQASEISQGSTYQQGVYADATRVIMVGSDSGNRFDQYVGGGMSLSSRVGPSLNTGSITGVRAAPNNDKVLLCSYAMVILNSSADTEITTLELTHAGASTIQLATAHSSGNNFILYGKASIAGNWQLFVIVMDYASRTIIKQFVARHTTDFARAHDIQVLPSGEVYITTQYDTDNEKMVVLKCVNDTFENIDALTLDGMVASTETGFALVDIGTQGYVPTAQPTASPPDVNLYSGGVSATPYTPVEAKDKF